MSNVIRITNKNWSQRVHRVAAKQSTTVNQARQFCDANGVKLFIDTLGFYNPKWLKKQ